MDCVVGLLLMMLGVVLFAYGRVPFATLEARGVLVRVAGAVLVLFPPLYLLSCIAIGFLFGVQAAKNPNGVNEHELEQKLETFFIWYWIAFYAVTLALAFLLVAVSFRSAEVRVKKRRYYDEDGNYIRDDEDDRPRKRRRRQFDD